MDGDAEARRNAEYAPRRSLRSRVTAAAGRSLRTDVHSGFPQMSEQIYTVPNQAEQSKPVQKRTEQAKKGQYKKE